MLRAFVDRPEIERATLIRRQETIGAIAKYTWDWAPYEAAEGVTVSSVAWATSNSGAVSISGDALSSSVSTAYLTAAGEGSARITLTATTSGTQKAVRMFVVHVVDPTVYDGEPSDYTS